MNSTYLMSEINYASIIDWINLISPSSFTGKNSTQSRIPEQLTSTESWARNYLERWKKNSLRDWSKQIPIDLMMQEVLDIAKWDGSLRIFSGKFIVMSPRKKEAIDQRTFTLNLWTKEKILMRSESCDFSIFLVAWTMPRPLSGQRFWILLGVTDNQVYKSGCIHEFCHSTSLTFPVGWA